MLSQNEEYYTDLCFFAVVVVCFVLLFGFLFVAVAFFSFCIICIPPPTFFLLDGQVYVCVLPVEQSHSSTWSGNSLDVPQFPLGDVQKKG